jgi:ubiquitin carboxyl-terminal hydrolase 7
MIQLKRFCFLEDKNCKIMKRIEFEETLDLTNYFSCKETKNQLPQYDLYAVIVHKGDSDSGHYYVYIKNTKDPINNPFIKFDDRVVKYATREEVFFENFVKNSIEIEKNGFFYKTQEESKNTPYILIYTDSSKKDYLFENYSIDKVKSYLIRFLPKLLGF